MDAPILGNGGDDICGLAWHFDSTLKQASKFITSWRRANANADTEVVSLRITGDESFGEYSESGTLFGGVCSQVGEFLKGPLTIEHHGRSLNDGDPHSGRRRVYH